MRPLAGFELVPKHTGLLETPRHELMYDGTSTGFFSEASDVVAQYQVGDYYLVATVLEVPKQEKLECYVFDKTFKKKAYRKYSGWFTSAFRVTGQQILPGETLEIELNKSICIQLKLTKKRLPWPRISLDLNPQFK